MDLRFLFYSHDGMGLGHVRRNLSIAAALTDLVPGASVLLANSTDEVDRLGVPPNVDVLKLPGVRKDGTGGYPARRLPLSEDEVCKLRAALLEVAVEAFRPHVILADKHPLGLGGELAPALARLRLDGGRATLGLRDVLDDPAAVRREWGNGLYDAAATWHDLVLVYGTRAVFDPITVYSLPPPLVADVQFCGYVVPPPVARDAEESLEPPALPQERPLVLATTGGGEDGWRLLTAFLEASRGAAWHGLVVTGPKAPRTQREALAARASGCGVTCHTFVPDLHDWFPRMDALVCMGGYNTLTQAVACGVPTVCVPRVWPRREQLLRAAAFERLGLVRCLAPDRLSEPGVLRREIEAALSRSCAPLAQRTADILDFDGAYRAAEHLAALAETTRPATRVHAGAGR